MLDLFNKLNDSPIYLIPWAALLAGLAGSLHCVGMCGGLVAATTKGNYKDMGLYHLGRLLSYLVLTSLGIFLGYSLNLGSLPPEIKLLAPITMGIFLIYWGIQLYRGKKLEVSFIKTPKSFYTKVFKIRSKELQSFFLGTLTLFLPCGFLYAFIFTLIGLNNPYIALLTTVGFWLGTLPSLVIAPNIFKKILLPLQRRAPKLASASLVLIGITTICYRVVMLYGNQNPSCH